MPQVQGADRVIALIDDPGVVRRILEHIGHWAPEPAERGPPAQAPDWLRSAVIPLTATKSPTSRSAAREASAASLASRTVPSPHASQDSRHLDVTGTAISQF
jgi:hypothetical protein